MPDKRFDVAVIGNVGIDTNVYFPWTEVDFGREANFTENLDYVGQAGGYASRGYAQLGKRTAFIGYVGDDFSGRFIREELTRDGIDQSALFVDPAGTSRSINFMYRDGRRKNFYDGKSHMQLQPDRAVCRSVLAGSRLAHFNIPNWARSLLPSAKELGVTIACDLQDVVSLNDGYREDFIEYADIVFFSAANQPDPTPLIEDLLKWKPGLIVVSGLGAQGCALGTREGIRHFGPVAMDMPVIDTNGAGDELAVGFLSSYVLEGYSLEDSIRRGQIAARYTCTHKASSAQLIRPDIMRRYFGIEQTAEGRTGRLM
ncbi:MAG TPA: carbohydrate kinase family protein [Anaerolineae bacterium]|nr:carbohydrate kinase family protein [Anaerolineae bacterium]